MKRFMRAMGWMFAVLWLWHGGEAFAAATPRIALVIGNSNYKIAPSLPNPANDARLMAKTLRGLGFEVIERIDADRETILLATFELQDRLIEAGRDAVGLFFYAGHGVQVAGENYFIPLKTEIRQEREVPVKAVSASFVLQQMEFADNRMNFVILDACRNNPFPASTRATTRGLARMQAPTGSLVAYSTGPGEVAVDGVGDNSPYVLALTEAMQIPNLPAELMFKRVRELVLDATNEEQTPWEETSLKGEDFYFNLDVSVTVETPGIGTSDTAATTQQETAFWNSIEESTDPASFEVYLNEYPNGKFAALARLRIRQSAASAIKNSPDPVTTDFEALAGDASFRREVADFYDSLNIISTNRGYRVELQEIESITLWEVNDTRAIYHVQFYSTTAGQSGGYQSRSENGYFHVQAGDGGYKFIKYVDRSGQVYEKISSDADHLQGRQKNTVLVNWRTQS